LRMRLELVLIVLIAAVIAADNRWERLREDRESNEYRHATKEHRSHEYRQHREGSKKSDEKKSDEQKSAPKKSDEHKSAPKKSDEHKSAPKKSRSDEEHKPKSREHYHSEHKSREHLKRRRSDELGSLGSAERRRQNYGLRLSKSKSHESKSHESKSVEKKPGYEYKNPFPIYIGKVIDVQKAGVSGDVYFVNSTTILIKKFNLPPGPPAIVFWIDRYNTLSGQGIHLKSDKYGYNVLGCYEDDDVLVTIPKSKEAPTLLSYHSFGIYCVKTQVNYGYIHW
jgi:hypothetical protein